MQPTEQLNTALVGRYAIERLVGEGGMATVYLARDVRHNRKVALKVLRPDLGAVVGVERFLSEIQVTANLQHPNLLPLFDSGEAGGLLFYVMPYVEGESLRARLEREKQLPVDDAVHIATAVASALDYAHRHGVIHRDLKPENILMHDGQPLVADFGIALAVSNAGGNRITQTGLSLGTPQYMSPEQATGDRTVDARTDIYSLGAVTYEMLAGEAPHTGTTSQAIIARVLTERPRTIRASRPSVPAHVEAAVEHALEKLPADRWASAKEFSEALNGTRPITTTSTTSAVAHAAVVTPARGRRMSVREIVLAAIAVAGVASTAVLATRHPPEPVAGRFAIVLPDSVVTTTASAHTVALSPDGRLLAILGERNGHREIYVRRIDDPVAQPVRGTDDALYHSFSPDGQWLLFMQNGALKTVSVNGGTPQTLADSAQSSTASWGDGGQVVYPFHNGLWVVSSDGGNRRLLAKPDSAKGFTSYSHPEVLPGGTHALIAMLGPAGIDSARLAVLSLRDGKVTDLGLRGTTAKYVASGHIILARSGGLVFAAPFSLRKRTVTGPAVLLFEQMRQAAAGADALAVARDNGTIAFESGNSGSIQSMYIVDRQGAERVLKSPVQMFREPRVSPDGKKIAVRIGPGTADGGLWIYEIAAGTLTRLTPDSASVRGVWSRDGLRVVYPDHASSDTELVVSRPWDGSGAAVVLARGGRQQYHEISLGTSHGYTAIRSGTDGAMDISLAPAESLSKPRPFLTGPADDYDPHVSPNGQLLAYTSNKTGSQQVYLTPIPGPGPNVQVSVDGGTESAWSADGTTLFYRGPQRMMAATVVERPSLTVTRREPLFADIYRRYRQHAAYDVFPNGREFLMTRGPDTRSTVFVVVNWQQLARARNVAAPR